MTLVHAIAESRKQLQLVIYGTLSEEKIEANLSKAETRRLHKMLGEWAERPNNRPFVERTIIRPAVQKVCRKTFENGRRQKHVEILLEFLQRNGIKLSESQRERLHCLPFENLPSVNLALDAKSTRDCVRKSWPEWLMVKAVDQSSNWNLESTPWLAFGISALLAIVSETETLNVCRKVRVRAC